MATNLKPGEGGQPSRLTAGRRGEVEVKVTADDLLSAATNVIQNQWPLEALGHRWMKPNAATQRMLEQIYEQFLEANRLAVEKRLAKRGR